MEQKEKSPKMIPAEIIRSTVSCAPFGETQGKNVKKLARKIAQTSSDEEKKEASAETNQLQIPNPIPCSLVLFFCSTVCL